MIRLFSWLRYLTGGPDYMVQRVHTNSKAWSEPYLSHGYVAAHTINDAHS